MTPAELAALIADSSRATLVEGLKNDCWEKKDLKNLQMVALQLLLHTQTVICRRLDIVAAEVEDEHLIEGLGLVYEGIKIMKNLRKAKVNNMIPVIMERFTPKDESKFSDLLSSLTPNSPKN